MSNKDYGEVLLQSTEQIVDSKLSMVKFDQTIICTIIDDSNAFNGEYQVSDGSVTFTAYSENRNYTKNMQVYVLIPQGNWANRKQITALYSKSEDIIVRKRKKDELVVIASGEPDKIENGSAIISIGDEPYYNIELVNTLYITFKIQTDLPLDYKFNIGVMIYNEDTNKPPENILSFSSDQMFGNSSYYFTPVQQEIICPLNKDTTSFSFIRQTQLKFPANIQITDIKAFLCHDISQYDNNTVLLFPIDRMNIYTNDSYDVMMQLIWVNKDKYGKYIGFGDGSFDKERGKGIEIDNGIIINGYEPIDSTTGENYYWIDWYYDTKNKRLELERSHDENVNIKKDECFVDLLTQFTNTDVQARVWKNGKSYDSNIFTFKNMSQGEDIQLIKDSLLRLNNGESFDIDCDLTVPFITEWDKDDNVFEVYYIYPSFKGDSSGSESIKFAPGQQIKFINKTTEVYEDPIITYTSIEHSIDGPLPGESDSQNFFETGLFQTSVEVVNDQDLRIKLRKESQRAGIETTNIKISNVSSLCFTIQKEDVSKNVELITENDLYNRLNAAEARIQQLEKQLSAYI